MKKDLEQLIKNNNVDALWISGAAQHNPSMVYFTGPIHVTMSDLFIIPGKKPILFHGVMESEEAAKTGFDLICYTQYPMAEFVKETAGNQLRANALRYRKMLTDIGLTEGTIMLYGNIEFGPFYSLIREIEDLMPGIHFKGDYGDKIILEARATKDPAEIEEIRKMGVITTGVVQRVQDFMTAHKVVDETLIKEDGNPLTIGDVKSLIDLWLAEAGAENPESTIFAIGRDAGFPHSGGTPSDPIQLGKTIVFDIFPCQSVGVYFYDITRTLCLGYSPEEIQLAYIQVKEVYDRVAAELELGAEGGRYQELTCQLFEDFGHETIRKNPAASEGYIHSLGHGLGLNVHEKPWLGRAADPTNTLKVGSVFTLEPGLYYPSKGYGIRLEDSWYVKEDGSFEKFVDFPMDLVIPMKGG